MLKLNTFLSASVSVILTAICSSFFIQIAEGREVSNSALTSQTLEMRLQGKCAASIPTGFDWPASPTTLYKISGGIKTTDLDIPGQIDMAAQRKHGWNLFAGVTQPSTPDAQALPVFHTWYTVEETFDPADGKISCAERKPLFRLSLPTQLVMELNQMNPLEANFDNNAVAFSHVAFNTEMYEFIRDNKYYKKQTLDNAIDPTVSRRPVVNPPVKGVSLKFAWWPAAPDKLSPVPVWDFDPRFEGDAKNPPATWKRIVMVDPVGGLPSPNLVRLGGFDHNNPITIPIDRFYSVKVSAAEAAAANSDFRIKKAAQLVLGRDLQEGDYLLMMAMHIATREFDPWVWLTYWWTDKPGNGPLAQDMPNIVKGVWRNYVMDVSYNINEPKLQDGAAPVSYNPWLELFQEGGTRSQCMACHARAAYGPGVRANFNPDDMSTSDKNGFEASPNGPNDPVFKKGTVSLHRVWTIFTRAQ